MPNHRLRAIRLALILAISAFLAGCGGRHGSPIQEQGVTQREVEIRLDLAEAYLRNNEPRLALQELYLIQPQAQSLPHFHFTLGYTRLLLGNGAEAAGDFRRAVELDSGHAEAWNNLGLALLSINQIEEAKKAFTSALSISTQRTPEVAALNLAQLYMDSDRQDLALQYVNLALELNRRFPEAYLLAAEIELSRGKAEHAVAILKQGVEANAENPRILLTLAEYLIFAEQNDQALVWLDRLLNTAPNSPEAKIALEYKRSLGDG
jgi:Tfp pilus assembly protein PilF